MNLIRIGKISGSKELILADRFTAFCITLLAQKNCQSILRFRHEMAGQGGVHRITLTMFAARNLVAHVTPLPFCQRRFALLCHAFVEQVEALSPNGNFLCNPLCDQRTLGTHPKCLGVCRRQPYQL